MNNEADTSLEATLSRQLRTTRERLGAMLGRSDEALPPRVLRRTLRELQNVADPTVSDVEGGRRAAGVARWYASATPEQRQDCWLLMSEQFPPDPTAIQAAHAAYDAARNTDEEARAEVRLRKAFASPRTRLLQRFAAFPDGVRFLVDMRAELLPRLKQEKRLLALDAELEDLFSTWFDVGFLELRRIDWHSPASLIEKLIKYEAVHDVRSWADAKNRLDEDRRCYGFFHPRLPGEPLIFVEVALLKSMAGSITPLLDEEAEAADLDKATTAIFYSISNTQPGLRGVSFGDSLIKRVVEALQHEFPQLKVFATLSPIPGLRGWLGKQAGALLQDLPPRARQALAREVGEAELTAPVLLKALDDVPALGEKSAVRRWLLSSAARYLARELTPDGRPLDAVARFHLGNGARVERLNWLGDPSPKGLRQSYGLMVNYLYDLKRLDRHRALLAQGKVPLSSAVESLQDG
ncbi:malonyl-CoA decarboxylase [Ottowia sp. SB7-C50]|uniref:malonyl-CoA decarboxylase n=1 Tax=Ottowia sp. SB7-C50 TaxID=3081231 RepID=UPI0029545EC6|nr:malonyl-CoA decarboxylase [Ottowia sp. SB7-C50]WOP14450.1 malonyl-CoA decarboxylase [Ottowia sp. SB7-C50]